MISPDYRAQVELLLKVLPYVAEQEVFALKGGTAINLFHRNMPRLSVDIDLTYLPKEDRKTALQGIADGLDRIKQALENKIDGIQITKLPQSDGEEAKLLCGLGNTKIKIEVNTNMRGNLWKPEMMPVADAVQDEFKLFASINVVSKGELYGGKICAALDRQHPRDLFDIQVLLNEEGITEATRLGFIASLLASGRPIHEMLQPNFQDQRSALESQLRGMSDEAFSYEDFEAVREKLVSRVGKAFSDRDRAFLVSFKTGEPDWSLCPVEELEKMPAVKWKLQNIQKLKKTNPEKHEHMLERLEKCLETVSE